MKYTYRELFEGLVANNSYSEIFDAAREICDRLESAVGYDMIMQLLCVGCAVDGSVNTVEHQMVSRLLYDNSGIDAFVRLVNSFNTAYMFESTAEYFSHQSDSVAEDAIKLLIAVYAAKGKMSSREEDFLRRLWNYKFDR